MATLGTTKSLRAHRDVQKLAERLAGPGGSVRPLGKVISQAQAPGVNGERRVHATRAGQHAAVGHVEVVHAVHLAPDIDHRGRRVGAGHHAAQSMGGPGEARVSGHAGQPGMQDATLERSDDGVMLAGSGRNRNPSGVSHHGHRGRRSGSRGSSRPRWSRKNRRRGHQRHWRRTWGLPPVAAWRECRRPSSRDTGRCYAGRRH